MTSPFEPLSIGVITFNVGLDLFPMLAATLAAVGCGVLGNFLVLRRLSLMGDAISHSVLPGLVIAFLIASTRSPLIMFAGASIAGIATVVLVELVKKLGRVEPGAAMGVVFSILFALGVLLIESAAVRHIDLDAECVLHGQLETLVWYGAPESVAELLKLSTLDAVPRQVTTLAVMATLSLAFIGVFFKELRIAAFDPDLATTQGFNATLMHFLLMIFVAAATVASFEAVGSILVIAMLVCPAATARLLTDRLAAQIGWSVAISLVCGIGGYLAATAVPAMFARDAVNAAGCISMVAGALLALAIIASPKHGVVTRFIRHKRFAQRIAVEDLLAALYRASEADIESVTPERLAAVLAGHSPSETIARAAREGLVSTHAGTIRLTASGHLAAMNIVRRHRLWEHYLVDEAGFAPDHVHSAAEQLEHVITNPPVGPDRDPHGRRIP
ncbi:MAG: metal ABC transporter permease [Planctomycetes bacterium]|nr:metal ABC transporter permease [Planctomycetota bacterium]